MTFRSFKSALSAIALSVSCVAVEPPAPPAAGAEQKKPKEGYVRFWNFLPAEVGDLTLLQESGSAEGTALVSAAPMNYYADYVPLKPGGYALKVVRAADPKTPLKAFNLPLRADVFVTFVARVADGKASIELLDDTYDPAKALAGNLTIRQHVPNATVTVTSSAIPAAAPLGYGAVHSLENLPLQPVLFRMQATLPNGQPRSWSCEVDFRNCRHATLLLVLDQYGRFRPRMSPDGQTEINYQEK